MKIRNLMSEPVVTVHPTTPLVEAVNFMEKLGLHNMAVVSDGNKMEGMLSESKLSMNDSFMKLKTMVRMVNKLDVYKKDDVALKNDMKKFSEFKVVDYMDSTPTTLSPEDPVERAAQLMTDPNLDTVPVVEDGKLLGTLSLLDLTKLYGISPHKHTSHDDAQKHMDQVMKDFEKKFLLVSRFRTQTWMFTSLMFALVGFVVAFMLILRITIE